MSPDSELDADHKRLEALYRYQILDTPAEPGFDDVVQLASQICDAPASLVSLVDKDRQWFKARVGFGSCETPLSQSVCAHALRQDDILVIPDLTVDPRTAHNTLVTGAPHLRFYAGVRLDSSDGLPLGTLCVLDSKPRPQGLTEAQASALKTLGRQTMAQIELRLAVRLRERALADQQRIEQALRAEAAKHDALVETQRSVQAAGKDRDAIFEAVVQGALRVFPAADGALIETIEDDSFVCKAVAGVSFPLGVRLFRDHSLSGRSVDEGRPMICFDTKEDSRVDAAICVLCDVGSMIVVPIFRNDTASATLKLQARRTAAFAEADLVTLQLLAGTMLAGLSSIAEASATEAARKSEVFSHQILESAVDYAIVTADLDGQVTSWSQGARQVLGWHEDEMIGQPIATFFTEEDRANRVHEKEMRNALASGRGKDERWHLRADGSVFWANGEMMPLKAEDGSVEGFIKILRDQTQQRLADEALMRSEEEGKRAKEALHARVHAEGDRLRALLNDAPSFMAVLRGPDLRFELANRAYYQLVGRAVLGLAFRKALPELEGQGFFDRLEEVYRTNEPFKGTEVAVGLRQDPHGEVTTRFINFVCQPILDGDGQVGGIFINGSDVTESTEAKIRVARLIELGDRIRDLKAIPAIVSVAAEILGTTLKVSRCGYGKFDPSGHYVTVLEDWRRGTAASAAGFHTMEDFGSAFAAAVRQGRTVAIADVAQDPLTAANAESFRTLDIAAIVNVPIIDADRLTAVLFIHDDQIRHWSEADLQFAHDVAERTRFVLDRVEAEERQHLLAGELQHRMKNTLAMVQAIANQTMRSSATKEEAAKAFSDRLMALSKAQDILTQTSWGSAPMLSVVRAAVRPHDVTKESRFRIEGPDLNLNAKSALAFSLALHELATNALKYGALSDGQGYVAITWSTGGDSANPVMTFRWQEHDGPVVERPERKGFGSRVIKGGFPYDFKVDIAFEPTGVTCDIVALVAAL